MSARIEHLLRTEAPQVLGALVRRFGRFDVAEDAVQEALLAASRAWAADGVPADPRSWLIRVGYRRMVDLLRSDQARHRRELETGITELAMADPSRGHGPAPAADDSLTLLLLCCHPALSPSDQVALTLRAVGGLTTAEIAHAHGPTRGLALLDDLAHRHGLETDPLVRHRAHAVRAHLLRLTGATTEAAALYRKAAALTDNEVERRYLLAEATRLT